VLGIYNSKVATQLACIKQQRAAQGRLVGRSVCRWGGKLSRCDLGRTLHVLQGELPAPACMRAMWPATCTCQHQLPPVAHAAANPAQTSVRLPASSYKPSYDLGTPGGAKGDRQHPSAQRCSGTACSAALAPGPGREHLAIRCLAYCWSVLREGATSLFDGVHNCEVCKAVWQLNQS
jgi:hypothetical protein